MVRLPVLASAWALGVLGSIALARDTSPQAINAKRAAAAQRIREAVTANSPAKRAAAATVKNITFSNPKASEFFVDGSTIPLVDFDVGPSWSGLIPISNATNEDRKLFFWFFPPGPEGSLDDLIFWTNGGPGCSSLEGALQENGPITWSWGQAKPTLNEFSWTNLSSLLFIEQPVGTGFSQGTPTARNEEDVAEQLAGFLQQFLEIFSELKGKNFFVTGESYAGMYVPYIANFIYENPGVVDLNLKGIWVSDPVLGQDVAQSQIPALPFVQKYANVFSFDANFMSQLQTISDECGYTGYLEKFVTYPPTGILPLPNGTNSRRCDIWDTIFNQAVTINPAFNIYRVFDTFPILWDVLGFPGSFPQAQTLPLYFDRQDVKLALHAPTNVSWVECSNINVFPQGDASLPPALNGVLANVIEKSNRTVIAHGLGDFILIAEGARIVLQNMTWGGAQGFQSPLVESSFVVDGMGPLGNVQSERGLTYYEVVLSGHMIPQFSPVAAMQIMSFLMGFRDTP
ncbi:alpha/beta-hydrolase [Vararia minispora EC-137]|uniref:Alpha/beta-hydrolase n=1 Tax=Vararia minispora EC-137 TaxID=1314806 RepID=A0ACB8QV22_9AGAM|nr:alpha/beta-hydrolase [Vararia minispora EC-137]